MAHERGVGQFVRCGLWSAGVSGVALATLFALQEPLGEDSAIFAFLLSGLVAYLGLGGVMFAYGYVLRRARVRTSIAMLAVALTTSVVLLVVALTVSIGDLGDNIGLLSLSLPELVGFGMAGLVLGRLTGHLADQRSQLAMRAIEQETVPNRSGEG